jgi:hypothetical protein
LKKASLLSLAALLSAASIRFSIPIYAPTLRAYDVTAPIS